MKIYLCGPILGCTDAEANDWRTEAKKFFPRALDPMRRDYRGIECNHMREIVENDKQDIRESDGLLVYFTKPSVGTAMEVLYAWERHLPIAVVDANGGQPISPWLAYHADGHIFLTLTAAANWLASHWGTTKFKPLPGWHRGPQGEPIRDIAWWAQEAPAWLDTVTYALIILASVFSGWALGWIIGL